MKNIGREDIEIKSIARLGNYSSKKQEEGKCRPLKICFHSVENRDSVMRNLFKLKNTTDDDLSSIQVKYDLLPSEREHWQEMIQEAKRRSTNEVFWLVRGPPWALRLESTKPRPKNTPAQTTAHPNTIQAPANTAQS